MPGRLRFREKVFVLFSKNNERRVVKGLSCSSFSGVIQLSPDMKHGGIFVICTRTVMCCSCESVEGLQNTNQTD